MQNGRGNVGIETPPTGEYEPGPQYNRTDNGGEDWLQRFGLVDLESTEEAAQGLEGRELINKDLPIYAYREEIKQAARENDVFFLVGKTGSGKTTQIGKILLEDGHRSIDITQPLRLTTRKGAERIQFELSETLGESAENLVGFRTAEQSTVVQGVTVITLLTDGIEAARRGDSRHSEKETVVVIDEAHENNKNTDLAMALWRDGFLKGTINPNATLILSSATMDTERLTKFFEPAIGKLPPVIEVPGRGFPIEIIEAPDSTALKETLKWAEKLPDTGILVFLPGKREIADMIDEVSSGLPKNIREKSDLLALHAKQSNQEQDRVTDETNLRKIIFSTDAAQTGVTLPSIGVVIHSGIQRRIELDSNDVEGLVPRPISRSDMDQQGGRTGRVAAGINVRTRLDESSRYIPYENRDQYTIAEIHRTNFDHMTLRAAALGINLTELPLPNQVEQDRIERSQARLISLGALDSDFKITTMGLRMNKLPLSPASGRMIIEAEHYSPETRAYAAAGTAALEVEGLPYFAFDVGKRWRTLSDESSSDFLTQIDIFIAVQDMTDAQLVEYDLDVKAVRRAQEVYKKTVERSGAFTGKLLPPTPEEREELKQCFYAGMLDNVYKYVGNNMYESVGNKENDNLREISSRSQVPRMGKFNFVVGNPRHIVITANGKQEARNILQDVTTLPKLAMLGAAAVSHCTWIEDKPQWCDNQVMVVSHQSFKGALTGNQQRHKAAPSSEARQVVLDHIRENPGPAQKQLHDIKKKLENFRRIAKDPVPQLTEDTILGWIKSAAPDDVLDQTLIDNNLRLKIVNEGISLESYLSAAKQQEISDNAPGQIIIDGNILAITYRNGKPQVKKFDVATVLSLPGNVSLPDGRPLLFIHKRRPYTARDLGRLLSGE